MLVGGEIVGVIAPETGELGGQIPREWLQHLLAGVVDVANVLTVGGFLVRNRGSHGRGGRREGKGGGKSREQHCEGEGCCSSGWEFCEEEIFLGRENRLGVSPTHLPTYI